MMGQPSWRDRSKTPRSMRPWVSVGRHAFALNEPEQLRGPLSPHHARTGHRGGGMTNIAVFGGVDVSKAQLDIAVRPEGRLAAANAEKGSATTRDRPRQTQPRGVGLEATGGFEGPRRTALPPAG